MSSKDSYIAKVKAQLDELKAELDILDTQVSKAKADTKIKYQEQIGELHQKHAELARRLTKIQEAREDVWEDLKGGFENVWDSMKESFSRAKSEFERGYREGQGE